jgi:predicted rRNA methylase YqxC with S4 and FtsJ domains
VCRAGYKLEAALDTFGVDVTGCVALDAGLSTGGFTDCLLQRGAARVYGIDVGYGQARAATRRTAQRTGAALGDAPRRVDRCMTASGATRASS